MKADPARRSGGPVGVGTVRSMLLADLVATADAVAATSKRTEKVAAMVELFGPAGPRDLALAVGLLAGEPRQGRIGVGWATISAIDVAPAEEPGLTVVDLDAALDRLATTSGPGSAAARTAELESLLGATTPAEGAFVRRLLTGELRQGALAALVADALAKATGIPQAVVRRATMLSGDLAAVADAARRGGRGALEAIGLTLFRPVQPMLAATSADVAAAIEEVGTASVEWKLDGIRVQVHRSGDDVAVYTRNLNDITDRLPGVAELVRSFDATALVLDGEAIGLGADERPDLFQDTMSRAGRQDGEAGTLLVPRFFDCLHLDGADLLDRPLTERRAALDAVAGPTVVPSTITADPDEAAAVLDDALAAGHEGVVVKAADSPYQAGRRGKNWRKVKPVRTLDLVVLAAEWGHGRRRGWLSNLHLGARDPAPGDRGTGGGGPGEGFVMVGKTFKGLTDALLTWQTAELQARAVADHGHVVEVRPELVVEVALDGVQRSTRYPGGVALRFARVRRYRPDKSPADADLIDTVRALLRA